MIEIKKIFNNIKKDNKLMIFAVIGIIMIVAGLFTATYTETAFKFGGFSVDNKPYTNWTPPLIVGGIVILIVAIYMAMNKK